MNASYNTYYLMLPSLLLASVLSMPVHADMQLPVEPGTPSGPDTPSDENTGTLVKYMLNLGAYLGYDLKADAVKNASHFLLETTKDQLLGSSNGNPPPFFAGMFDTFFGAIPANTPFKFVPTKNPYANKINELANATFVTYNSPTAADNTPKTGLSVSSAIDQKTYQNDPVSQAVLNILSTPDLTYCMALTGSPVCPLLDQHRVIMNVVGKLPESNKFFTTAYNVQFLAQLNSNTLIAPLLYSTEANPADGGNSTPPAKDQLTAKNQEQEAANFIRYATAAVVPISLPSKDAYEKLLEQTIPKENPTEEEVMHQIHAEVVLTAYFAKLRAYAAQSSVAYSNLYYILSRRVAQKNTGGPSTAPTSQALNEFTMATWRLYNPSGDANNDWLTKINGASSATVGKEMVTLLAEINYQLYLTRQQQERLLLTNSMLLLLGTRTTQPSAPSAAGGNGDDSGPG